jgi:hypothetical protein
MDSETGTVVIDRVVSMGCNWRVEGEDSMEGIAIENELVVE